MNYSHAQQTFANGAHKSYTNEGNYSSYDDTYKVGSVSDSLFVEFFNPKFRLFFGQPEYFR